MSTKEIFETLNRLENKIDVLDKKLDTIIVNNEKLDNHIDFIDHVYSTIKTPLDYISKKFGGGQIEDKK